MTPRHRIAALAAASLWALALAACSGGSPPPSPGPTGTAASGASSAGRLPACKLPAPLKSADTCSSDADCGVSEPCHARACVGKARSHPPAPDTACTQIMECQSADANRCGCLEGRCALIPPS